MGLFDKFKKTKEAEKPKAPKTEPKVEIEKKEKKAPVRSVEKKEKTVKAASGKKVEKKESSQAWRVLQRPLVTEKATLVSEFNNQYIFQVAPQANKNEIKKAVQDFYGVKVEKVNIINVMGKTRRVGRHEGFRSGFKKAIVFLREGEKIEIIAR